MKLLELEVWDFVGVFDGTYSFMGAAGKPSHLVVVGNDDGELLATIAAVLEVVRGPG